MKFARREHGRLLFEFRNTEREVFSWVLRLYPVMADRRVELTRDRSVDPKGEYQKWLEDSLAGQRKTNQRRVEGFLNDTQRFEKGDGVLVLRLTGAEAEWLLEVLNEVRVGSWTRLGCPDRKTEQNLPRTDETMRHHWAVELSGYLETQLLEGLAGAH